jgi:hypothetical protein
MIAEEEDFEADVRLRRNAAQQWSLILDGVADEVCQAQWSSPGQHACLSKL